MRRKQGKPYKFGNGGEVPGYADGGELTPRAQQAVGMLMQGAANAARGGGGTPMRRGPPQGMPQGAPQGMPPQGPPQGMPMRAPPAQAALAAGAVPAPAGRAFAKGGSIDGVAKRGKTKCRSV